MEEIEITSWSKFGDALQHIDYCKITASKPVVETMTGKKWDDVPDWPTFRNLLNDKAESPARPYSWEPQSTNISYTFSTLGKPIQDIETVAD